jgi:hypothetical protein
VSRTVDEQRKWGESDRWLTSNRRTNGTLHPVVAANVWRLLEASHYQSQRQLALAAHMNVSSLCAKLQGRDGWTLVDLERLAEALDVEPSEFLLRGAS